MSKNFMYECRKKCLCARCKHVNGNCATCNVQFEKKFSLDICKQCGNGGVKKCEYFIEIEDEESSDKNVHLAENEKEKVWEKVVN